MHIGIGEDPSSKSQPQSIKNLFRHLAILPHTAGNLLELNAMKREERNLDNEYLKSQNQVLASVALHSCGGLTDHSLANSSTGWWFPGNILLRSIRVGGEAAVGWALGTALQLGV